MQLERGAGEDGSWSSSPAPAASEPGQPTADDEAGEMLLRDAGAPALPPLAELTEIREYDVTKHGGQRELREQAVEHRLSGGLVERVQGLAQRSRQLSHLDANAEAWRRRGRGTGHGAGPALGQHGLGSFRR